MASILAIDPGSEQSGWVVYDGGRVVEADTWPNEKLVGTLGVIPVQVLAIELIEHYGKGMPAGKSIFDSCIWIGRFMQAWVRPHEVKLIPRREVKLELCGSSRAKDSNVRQALIDRLGPPGRKANPGPTYGVTKHAWAALATAVVAEERLKAQAEEAS